jgi:hypothetical protein
MAKNKDEDTGIDSTGNRTSIRGNRLEGYSVGIKSKGDDVAVGDNRITKGPVRAEPWHQTGWGKFVIGVSIAIVAAFILAALRLKLPWLGTR